MLPLDEMADLRLLRPQARVICSAHIVALARVSHSSQGWLASQLQSPEGRPRTLSQRLSRPICLRRAKGFTIYGLAPDALRSCRTRSHS
jgi:hypothetical protein